MGNKIVDQRALYRKYRSQTLADVVGQTHITDILQRALKQGKVAHAYLFTGPRGVGKTSVARILAREINNLTPEAAASHPDIIEIDAASNRRIDDIRDLREKVQIAPTAAKYKVYIIDEVHMLTGESFNAFLKTLEEPPAHVVFILATTDAHKLPVTITSRTQRFGFRAIAPQDAKDHLRTIAKAEAISIDDEALELIAQHGDGSFRDSISLLDQLSSLADKDQGINRPLVERVLGLASTNHINKLIAAYLSADRTAVINLLTELEQEGMSATVTATQLLQAVRTALADTPQLTALLSPLIAVSSSPRPDIALLIALIPPVAPPAASTKSTAAAAVASAPAELQPLEKEALRPQPSEAHIRRETKKQPSARQTTADTAPTPPQATQDTPASDRSEPAPTPKAAYDGPPIAFDWENYRTHMKEVSVALSSILAKCKGEVDGATLMIYTGTAFWKKKLDDIKYQPALHDGLKAIGVGELTIETIAQTMPPKDSQAAAVAAIMGGGEEVSL